MDWTKATAINCELARIAVMYSSFWRRRLVMSRNQSVLSAPVSRRPNRSPPWATTSWARVFWTSRAW
eukprot:10207057-Alexandrium_andersonii.AAC.1